MMRKITPIAIAVSLLLFFGSPSYAYPSRVGFDCKQEQNGLFQAVREGKTAILQLYLDNKCSLNVYDGRGFTLYDLAALQGQNEVIKWLVDHKVASEEQYSPAMYKLLQTGLRFLNHDAGVVDGTMNPATADGIRSFQKFIKHGVTGKPDPSWLPIFNQHLTKKMQLKLNELGFQAGSPDGIIGGNTRSAMQAFRQERKMPKGEYGYIDDQLIYQLMMAENEANKKAIARRDAERQARLIAQQAAQRQEEARRRAEAQRRATEKRQQAEAEAQRLAQARAAEEIQRQQRLIAQQQKAEEIRRRDEAERLAQQQRRAADDAATAQLQEAQRLAEQRAQAQAREKQRQEQLRLEQQQREAEVARQRAEAARRAEELARQQAEEAEKIATAARTEARTAFRAAETGKPIFALSASKNATVTTSEGTTAPAPVAQAKKSRKPGFQKVSGKLVLNSKGHQLIGCSVGGQSLDVGWCKQYYPRGAGKRCQAVVSNTGVVVSLTCK